MLNKTFLFLIILVICSLLAGCGKDKNSNRSNNVSTEAINNILVPPEPEPATNMASIAGIDSNNNGLRDDVERIIAFKFGSNPIKYEEAKKLAKAEQALITYPSKENKELHTKVSICNSLEEREILIITEVLLNTEERARLYAISTAGSVIQGGDLCQ